MVRLSDLHPTEAKHMLDWAEAMTPVPAAPWIEPKPLSESTVAIVTTSGIHRRSDPPFQVGAIDYRILPGDIDMAECVMSHVSANFDRSAFQQDPNIAFPLDRLREMDRWCRQLALLIHGRSAGSCCAARDRGRSGSIAGSRWGRRCPACAHLTDLYGCGRRPCELHRTSRSGNNFNQPDSRTVRGRQSAAGAVGSLCPWAPPRKRNRSSVSNQRVAGRP